MPRKNAHAEHAFISAKGCASPYPTMSSRGGLDAFGTSCPPPCHSQIVTARNRLIRNSLVAEFTFHDLRRTFASLLVSKGVSIYKVAKWLGDGVTVVESTYGHLLPADDDIDRT